MLHFLHISDLHFGRTKHSALDTDTGLQTSLINDINSLNEAVDIAEREKVDFIAIAGDVFDKIHVSNAVRKEVAKVFRRILDRMHLYVIVGTHDRAHDKYAAHTLSDWMNFADGEGHMSRLHVFDKPTFVHHRDSSGKSQGQIVVLPEPTKGILEGKTYLEYVDSAMSQMALDQTAPILVIAHFAVTGAKVGDEQKDVASYRQKEAVPVSYFDERGYLDYVALGHIHLRQELGRTGKVVYPGSMNYCSFTELGQQKYVYIVNISDEKVLEKKFVELKSPVPLREIVIDVRGEADPMQKIRDELKKAKLSKSIAKISIAVHESEKNRIDEKQLKSALKNTISHSVAWNIDRGIKMRDATINHDTEERDAYNRYLEILNYPPDITAEMKAEFEQVLVEYKTKSDIVE